MGFISNVWFLALGWFIGLLIAMPVGPVAALSVKRTLHAGWPVGVATGLGASVGAGATLGSGVGAGASDGASDGA